MNNRPVSVKELLPPIYNNAGLLPPINTKDIIMDNNNKDNSATYTTELEPEN